MLSKRISTLFALAIASFPLGAQVGNQPVSVVALDQGARRHGPIIDREKGNNGTVTSRNWSGYAVTGDDNSFTYAGGSWIVPAVTCDSQEHQYASFWVGIDGYSSNTVEQTGTDSDCDRGGMPVYYAWYEFYPAASFRINRFPVKPGDQISASVNYADGEFTVTIQNLTTGKDFSVSSKVASAARSSAEWIAEAPSSILRVLPLANFGTALFGGNYTGVGTTNCATQAGACGLIGSYATTQQITMVTRTKMPLAVPSVLSVDGSSFSVAFQ